MSSASTTHGRWAAGQAHSITVVLNAASLLCRIGVLKSFDLAVSDFENKEEAAAKCRRIEANRFTIDI